MKNAIVTISDTGKSFLLKINWKDETELAYSELNKVGEFFYYGDITKADAEILAKECAERMAEILKKEEGITDNEDNH